MKKKTTSCEGYAGRHQFTGTTSRREFLVAAGGLGLSLSGICRAAPAVKPWQPKLVLSSVIFEELSIDDLCAKAVELGYQWIDLWGPFGGCRHLAEARDMGVEKFNAILKKHGVGISNWTGYRIGGAEEGLQPFAEFIGAAGGGTFVRESAYGNYPDDNIENSMKELFKSLAPEIALAKKSKVVLAIENHGDAVLDTVASFRAFTKFNPDLKTVGVGIAPYHILKIGQSVEEVIKVAGNQLKFFYAWQPGGGLDQLPGIGPVDMKPWLKELAALRYEGPVAPFFHGHAPMADRTAAMIKAREQLTKDAMEIAS